MPNQVDGALLHTMSGTELSHVRTELQRRRVRTTVPPHPVQPNGQAIIWHGDAGYARSNRKGGYWPPLLLLPVVAGYIVNFVLSAHPAGGKRA